MAKRTKDRKEEPQFAETRCGAQHDDCPSSWKGTCDLGASHDGSHHCGACGSMF